MDLLARVREVLSGKKSYKRKSTFAEELELSSNKRSRISEMNGDYSDEHFNSGMNYDPTAYIRNPKRRTDSFLPNHPKSSFFVGSADRLIRQHNTGQNGSPSYNFQNYDHSDEFKQPMPPPSSNGSKRIPNLLSAGRSAFSRSFNKPQQTINPHYSKFGEPSELQNFKTLPDLYLIPRQNRQNSHASISSSLVNGHDSTSMRHGSQSNQRFVLNNSNIQSNTLFNNNKSYKSMGLTGNSILSGKANPPINLDRANYQTLLNMIPGYNYLKKSKKNTVDETSFNAHGIIDLSSETDAKNKSSSSSTSQPPKMEPINSLKARIETNVLFNRDWEKNVNEKYSSKSFNRRDSLKKLEQEAEECERKTRDTEDRLKESFNKITISSIVYEEEEEEVPANDYPRLEPEMQQKIYQWISGRNTGQTIISKFNLSISPHDIQTLQWNPLTWLNDEVINFYMELLGERSRTNKKLPKVHGMNTFFLKRLLENGYSGVRRWTRKVDIFAHDIIPVPVHKGIHWCMAIIHMKNKTIKYYDSMGAPNNGALTALVEYLKAESLDKKKVEFDMTGWTTENVRNIPQQENGSDCGVFSCMYAEFVTRNRPIVFTQQHMQYFRMKMVYEICTGTMLN